MYMTDGQARFLIRMFYVGVVASCIAALGVAGGLIYLLYLGVRSLLG